MTHMLFHRNNTWQTEVRDSTSILAKYYANAGYRVTFMEGVAHIGRPRRFKMCYRDENVNVFAPLSLIPVQKNGIFSLPPVVRAQYRLCLPSIRTLIKLGGYGDPDIIWTTRVGSGILRQIFPNSLLIFQVVDYYPAFGGTHTMTIEKQDYGLADHIFTIGNALTNYLTNRLQIQPAKITTLGQGVELGRYEGTFVEPVDIKHLPHPRAIWVGVLSKGDPELFTAAAQVMSTMGGSLILIGPPCEWAIKLAQEFPHVKLLGPRTPEVIPDYLRSCEIGLMLYSRQAEQVFLGQNPLKLYEYAAAGLAIISTPHEEYTFQRPPVLIVNRHQDIQASMQAALTQPNSWKDRAFKFVSDKSWNTKFKISETVVKQLLEKQIHSKEVLD